MFEPNYYVTLTSVASLFSFFFLLLELWFFRHYGSSSIGDFSIFCNLFSWVFDSESKSLDAVDDNEVKAKINHKCPSFKHVSMECKVWRNSLSLFRGCEYNKFHKVVGWLPLTYYDMNLSSQDQQTFFSCQNDLKQPETKYMQEAWRERESIDRIFRAHEALEANKHCAVAWIIVAEEQAEKVEKAEQIFKIALKVAENNYQRNALTLTGSEIHEIPVNEVPSSSSASSYRSTRSGCFNHGSASTSSSQTYNFMFHDVDDQLNKLLNELRSDLGLETSVHTKTDKQQSKDTKSEKFRINDKTSLPISGFISNFGKILPTPANQLLFEELKRDLNVIVYIKRRLAMCLRKMGQLKEAVKMYKDLTKEFPLVNALNIHENLIEVYLEMGAYTDAQNVLTKYDDINLPKSAVICYTTALLKARSCADKYIHAPTPKLIDGLSYNYFEQANYFQSKQSNLSSSARNEIQAIEAIYRAVEFNPHVPQYLLELKQLIPPPEHVLRRGDSEAIAYSFFHLKHWKNIPGALNLLECTWKRTFQLLPNPLEKGNLFHPYQLSTEAIDRELLPSFHTVSVFYRPKRYLVFSFNNCVYFLCFWIAASSILVHIYPDYSVIVFSYSLRISQLFYSPLLHFVSNTLQLIDYMFPSGILHYLLYMLE